jgi:hypothetical protein
MKHCIVLGLMSLREIALDVDVIPYLGIFCEEKFFNSYTLVVVVVVVNKSEVDGP